ncbi:hypothetical protein ADICYQ_0659 [Cyclobacterium qasimii M12-11B]|uniref:Uncharacterized protein n=1 Tax=Cyclobacterium qasimii M12-11B TaxID=641524 RepID=S7X4Q3_9BACT|nr:hypothetical protein ADICYQ_0659 [Cyclobacterium qasimii M12-11B]
MVIPFFIAAIFHQVKVYESDFVSIVAEKKQQYRQNRVVLIVFTKA